LPELVAVMVAEPALTPVTRPAEFTVAAAELFVVQVMVCPVITLPFWSFTVAVRGVVAPATTEAEVGATVTVVATGVTGTAVTVIAEVPEMPAVAAVMVAVPAATPVTTPVEFTVATAVLLEDQAIVWPVIRLPFWSLTVTCNGVVAPTATEAEDGTTVTVVTTGGGADSDKVDAAARFESPPNVAPAFIAPRNAMTWKL
jgi:hypothetical protein